MTSHGRRATARRRASAPVEASSTEKPWRTRSSTTARRSASSGSATSAVRSATGVVSNGRGSSGGARPALRPPGRSAGRRSRRLGRRHRPDDAAVDGVEALEEPLRLPRPGEELHRRRSGTARGAPRAGSSIRSVTTGKRAEAGSTCSGRRTAYPSVRDGGMPRKAASPRRRCHCGTASRRPRPRSTRTRSTADTEDDARGGGGVLRHEDPVVPATQDALGGESVDRVRLEDHDTACVRQRSLPMLVELRRRAPGGWEREPRREARPRTAAQYSHTKSLGSK